VKLFVFAVLMIGLIAGPVRADDLNILAPAEQSAGWKLLFDGATLRGWRGFKSDTPGNGWSASDGELTMTGGGGDLVTVDEFGDFELSLEWKVGKGVNSGILYRVGVGGSESATFETGPEYQLLDNPNAQESPMHFAGALYDLVPANEDYTKPFGQWNEARITVRGWKIEHWLNGAKIVDLDLASPEGEKLVADSKFKTMPRFATLLRGHIALQDHGGLVSFRRIKIRELN
jgi:hypothetical protein